ncbi:MAG: quinoprotein dehydrogenase-associated SoxYZ-like carrier [Piscinibacter sp.]|nr:quinoprotein dehydrogenase-associated SoxYZ-like carrier [Piscinibacter sp.]
MKHLARLFALLLLVAAGLSQARNLQPTDDPESSPVWQKVRASIFEGRSIAPAPADMLVLEAPSRAIDAAVVPIAIRSRWPQGAGRYISKLYLIIDANPSPISAIFQFSPESGRAEIETRVRVDAYSHVRAIAETSDGQLFGVTRFVKASGGCSAPAGSDAQAAAASLGQMRFRVEGGLKSRTPVLAQLMIDHPNHSGLAMDQYSRQFTPAHYVRKVDVTYDGKPVFSADVDFSISENPNFRFWFLPQGNGELRATVVDSRDLRFVAAQALRDTPK